MSAVAAAVVGAPQQINLLNPALLPPRHAFSARQLVAWTLIAMLALGALGWWAVKQTRSLRDEIAEQKAREPAQASQAGPPPQQIAALEQGLRDRLALLENRRATLEASRRGMAAAGSGPSYVMRVVADTIPANAWLTEMRVGGPRVDLMGKSLDAAAVDAWLEKLQAAGLVAPRPAPSVRLERIDPATTPGRPAAYGFHISAALAAAFAEEGGRP